MRKQYAARRCFSYALIILFAVCKLIGTPGQTFADTASDNATASPESGSIPVTSPGIDTGGADIHEDNATIPDEEPFDPFEFDDPFGFTEERRSLFSDPLQGFNRVTFVINDRLYFWALKPMAIGFKYLLYPEVIRKSLRKCFINIAFPRRFLNCIFQLKMKGAGVELTRFVVNSTVGIAGLFDPSTRFFHLSPYDEDTGQTFGHYGMGPGCYLVVPIIIGPSTVRDFFGGLFDMVMTPFILLPGSGTVVLINDISLGLNPYEDLKKASLDPYIGIRNAYMQHRENVIAK